MCSMSISSCDQSPPTLILQERFQELRLWHPGASPVLIMLWLMPWNLVIQQFCQGLMIGIIAPKWVLTHWSMILIWSMRKQRTEVVYIPCALDHNSMLPIARLVFSCSWINTLYYMPLHKLQYFKPPATLTLWKCNKSDRVVNNNNTLL